MAIFQIGDKVAVEGNWPSNTGVIIGTREVYGKTWYDVSFDIPELPEGQDTYNGFGLDAGNTYVTTLHSSALTVIARQPKPRIMVLNADISTLTDQQIADYIDTQIARGNLDSSERAASIAELSSVRESLIGEKLSQRIASIHFETTEIKYHTKTIVCFRQTQLTLAKRVCEYTAKKELTLAFAVIEQICDLNKFIHKREVWIAEAKERLSKIQIG